MEINIYQTTEGQLISVIVRLLEKAHLSGYNCLFFSHILERVEIVDKTLWTFSTNSFIPHGSKKLGFIDKQPIYLTNEYENPNNSEILIIVDSFDYSKFNKNFKKIMMVFEDASQLEHIQVIYQDLKNSNKNVNYWKQSATGWIKDI